jgi:hypothetical protein
VPPPQPPLPGGVGPWSLGNDVVDLQDSRCRGKASDRRFLARVFSDREVSSIRESPFPDLALWLLWAGKEAAFKTVSKTLGKPPTFQHNRFRISFPDLTDLRTVLASDSPRPFSGTARYQDVRLGLVATVARDCLHVVSCLGSPGTSPPAFHWGVERDPPGMPREGGDWRVALKSRFSASEWACIPHRSSAITRLAARAALVEKLELEEGRLEIRCGPGVPGRRVPLPFLDGRPLAVDLSLSHHGTVSAWVFRDEPPESGPRSPERSPAGPDYPSQGL